MTDAERIAELEAMNTRLSHEVTKAQAERDEALFTARSRGESLANAIAANTPLREALRARGIHDRDCGAYRVPGRFGSQEGLRWNQSTDPLTCTCPLGVAILGCELGRSLPPESSPPPASDSAPFRQPKRREYSIGLDPSQPGGVRIEPANEPEPDLLDEAKRLLQKVVDTLPRESRMWSLIDTFLQVLKQKPADQAAALRPALISDHRFLPHPFGKDVCDRKLDDHGRVRTCARPKAEHEEEP